MPVKMNSSVQVSKLRRYQIFRFYRGKNYFDFMRLWEKVFTLLLINGREKQANSFYYECRNTFITKAKNTLKQKNISMKIKEDMQEYLDIALSLPVGLRSKLFLLKLKEKLPKIASHKQIMNNARRFRRANLIRHQFVSYPLLNYIESNDHDLTAPLTQIRHNKSYKMDIQKIENTPRYIHYDEFQLFELLGDFTAENLNKKFDFRKSRKRFKQEPVKAEESESPRIYSKVTIGKKNAETNENEINVIDGSEYDAEKRKENSGRGDGFRIGIVNLKVDERDIESAYIPGKKPNLSFGRQAKLHSLLNDSIRNPSCDLVIFPEVSIPFAWLPIMVSFARKHQIGIVLGLEHVIFNNLAFNLVVAILPYKTESGFNACHISVRPKNHYAPDENDRLMRKGFTPFSLKEPHYDLFHWRKTYFSVFNCFELSDITHKSILRSKIDFLLTVAWNKDINYYDNILSSIARDIHCYVIHSNTSQYGDSRVIVPARTEDKDPIRITGGETPVLMKYSLNIEALRNFQIQNYNPDNKLFKPLPAGYDKQAAQDRILDK